MLRCYYLGIRLLSSFTKSVDFTNETISAEICKLIFYKSVNKNLIKFHGNFIRKLTSAKSNRKYQATQNCATAFVVKEPNGFQIFGVWLKPDNASTLLFSVMRFYSYKLAILITFNCSKVIYTILHISLVNFH